MSTPRRVIHLLQGLETGGLEHMVVQLVEGCDARRFQPQVVTYDVLGEYTAHLQRQGIPVRLMRRRPGVDLRYVLRLAGYFRQARPDILHLHNPTAFFYGTLAGRLARVPRIVYTEHGRDFASSTRNRYLHAVLGRMIDRAVAVSQAGRDMLVQEGVPPAHIEVIHNGIDAAAFTLDEDRWGVREQLGLTRTQPVLGIVARLDPIKDHFTLLHAMRRLQTRHAGAVLLVIGDGPLRGELEATSRAQGLQRQVRFLGNRADVPALLAAIDVVVLCSRSEGLSLTLLEEGAAANARVATAVGGNTEIIRQGRTGLLVPPGDDAALAEALCVLLDDPEWAVELGAAARRAFVEQFTLRQMLDHYESLYESLSPDRLRGPAGWGASAKIAALFPTGRPS